MLRELHCVLTDGHKRRHDVTCFAIIHVPRVRVSVSLALAASTLMVVILVDWPSSSSSIRSLVPLYTCRLGVRCPTTCTALSSIHFANPLRRSRVAIAKPSDNVTGAGHKKTLFVSRRTSCYGRRTTCSVREDKV